MKLHLCCGDVYLRGYYNVDRVGALVGPDTADLYPTDLEHYYTGRTIGAPRACFVDKQMDLTQTPWPFPDHSAEEIVMIQGIEHFPLVTARLIMCEIKRVLKVGGRLLIDFPDIEATVKQVLPIDTDWGMRHLYGSERNPHVWGYTRATFRQLLGSGWSWVEFREIVKHDYPVIGCEAVRL